MAARVTLDTNVYVSAFQFGGMRLLHMAVNGDIEIAVSQAIIEEVIRVLRDKFGWDGYRLQDAKQQILTFARLVTPAQTLDVVKDDEPDNRILECVAEAGSEFIISADKDLLRLGSYAGASIMRLADFLQSEEEQPEQ
ncbi:MAG: putative toxin-antitoxin system toxin component, PIN family [Bryobacteraceae bacterium]